MTYIEIAVTTPEESRDALINRMSEMGAIGFIEQEGGLTGYFEPKQSLQKGGKIMTKAEMIEKIVAGADLSKADASRALDAALDAIKGALKKGQKVTLVGFGTFSVTKRKARMGRNPRTGQEIKIAAAKTPKFTAGKALKDAIRK